MSEFRRTTSLVEEVEKFLEEASEKKPSAVMGEAEIEGAIKRLKEWDAKVTIIEGKMESFIAKAEEKNPDKKIYGPGMIKRVKALAVRANELRPRMEELIELWEEAFQPIEAKRQAEAEEREREALERAKEAKRQEELRQAALRAKELAAAKRREAEELRAKEEQERLEKKRKVELEIERRKFEEQKIRLQKEAERRRRAENMSPREALEIIRSSNGPFQISRVEMTLRTLLGNIINDPGKKIFRRVRQANKHIQSELLQYPGAEDFLLAAGFRMKRIKVEDKEPDPKVVLREKILKFYKTFAPHELPKVDVPRVVDFFAGGKEADLWDRLRKKYGKSEEDLPDDFEADRNGQLFYVLDEPPVQNRDLWQKWFNGIKATRELLVRR